MENHISESELSRRFFLSCSINIVFNILAIILFVLETPKPRIVLVIWFVSCLVFAILIISQQPDKLPRRFLAFLTALYPFLACFLLIMGFLLFCIALHFLWEPMPALTKRLCDLLFYTIIVFMVVNFRGCIRLD